MIWKTQTAPKIQHFLWKMISKGLPLGEMLSYRRITQDVKCPHCLQPETTQHAFFDCYYAQQIWRSSNIPLPILYDPMATYETKIQVLLANDHKLPKEYQRLGFWLLWRIWKARNLLIFQKKRTAWLSVISMAISDCTEWKKAQVLIDSAQLTATSTTRACHRNLWKRPPTGWIKCNYDGAYKDTTRAAGLGWIFRDADEIYLGAGNAKMNATQALEGEVKALIMAMQHAWTRG